MSRSMVAQLEAEAGHTKEAAKFMVHTDNKPVQLDDKSRRVRNLIAKSPEEKLAQSGSTTDLRMPSVEASGIALEKIHPHEDEKQN